MEKTNQMFRFAIMGAGNIANRFCEAVKLLDGCCIAAVASKSAVRAKNFAERNGIEKYYSSYQDMLMEERPDCVYIATTTDAHYALSRLCLEHGVPVLCEKAMFMNAAQAAEIFSLSKEKQVFVMEAMWSRFLPAVRQAKAWIAEGAVGTPVYGDIKIGFAAPGDPENRYYNPALGGGAAYDIGVYCYEIMTAMFDLTVEVVKAEAVFGDTGVDVTDCVLLRFSEKQNTAGKMGCGTAEPQSAAAGTKGAWNSTDILASCTATFLAALEEKMVICGTRGRIELPNPHFASEAYLYDHAGNCVQHFADDVTINGFTYEIEEAMRCIRDGKTESEVVPHSLTLSCAELFEALLGL